MKLNKSQKNHLLIGLCAVVLVMAVGYAAFAQRLTINGTANVTSTWNVLITDIKEKVKNGGNSKTTPTYTNTTATFSSTLTKPGDYITYEVTVENRGTIDAILKTITKTDANNNAIVFTVDGIAENDTLASGATTTFTVKVEYSNSVTTQPSVLTSTLTLQLDYEQNKGSNTQPLTPQVDPNETIVYGYHYTDKCFTDNCVTEYGYERTITDGVSDYTQLSSYQSGKKFFLKYAIDTNNVIQKTWICAKFDFINDPVCIQGGKDSNNNSYYGTTTTGNRGLLEGLKSTFQANGGDCSTDTNDGYSFTTCYDGVSGLSINASMDSVSAGNYVDEENSDISCSVSDAESGYVGCSKISYDY